MSTNENRPPRGNAGGAARRGDEAGAIGRFQAIAAALDEARDVYRLAAGRVSP